MELDYIYKFVLVHRLYRHINTHIDGQVHKIFETSTSICIPYALVQELQSHRRKL